MVDLDFTGKVAFITGGSSGIGLGAALELARRGAQVGIFSRNQESLDQAKRRLHEIGAATECYAGDVSDAKAVKQAIDDCADRFGGLDIVFANAGINGVRAPIGEIAEDEYDLTMNGNLKGTILTVQAAVPHLKQRGKGAVLVTSSVNGNRIFSNTGATVYSMSKAGQVAMVKMLAIQLGQHKIRVNAICPGAIDTNIGENTEQRHTEEIKMPMELPEGEIPLTGKEPGSIEQVGRLVAFSRRTWPTTLTGRSCTSTAVSLSSGVDGLLAGGAVMLCLPAGSRRSQLSVYHLEPK